MRDRASFVSTKQAAETYGVTTRTLRRWISDGLIRQYKLGGVVRVDLDEIDAAFGVGASA